MTKLSVLPDHVGLIDDVFESGVIVKYTKKESSSTHYTFLHKTLMEFLAENYLSRNFLRHTSEIRFHFHFGGPSSRTVLWMLAGSLPSPAPFANTLLDWAEEHINSHEEKLETDFGTINVLLVDCLSEFPAATLPAVIRRRFWDSIIYGIDQAQRRQKINSSEWIKLNN